MTSTPSSNTDVDKVRQLRETLLDCYVQAIRNCATYPVELDEEITANYRKYLRALADEVVLGEEKPLLVRIFALTDH